MCRQAFERRMSTAEDWRKNTPEPICGRLRKREDVLSPRVAGKPAWLPCTHDTELREKVIAIAITTILPAKTISLKGIEETLLFI